jgi:ADP-heptose:LPS heptosyltransferase
VHELRKTREWLDAIGIPAHGALLAIGLGASRPTKSWGSLNFAAAAAAWCEQVPNAHALAIAGRGALEDAWVRDFSEAVLRASPTTRPRFHVVQSLGLRELAATLQQARVFLGNDSGPKHLAAAVGTPTVTLFGPEDPLEWHPYARDRHPYFFIESLACRRDAEPGRPPWCGLAECTVERHRCMNDIPVETVIAECLRLAALGAAR